MRNSRGVAKRVSPVRIGARAKLACDMSIRNGRALEVCRSMERAVILGRGQRLAVALGLGGPALSLPISTQPSVPAGGAKLAAAPDRDSIALAMTHSRGRVEGPFGAAHALRVAPHVLRTELRRLGLDWRSFRQAP